MGKLDGKVAIVTGGARGMGAATAQLFASEGANVVVADILEEEGRELADNIGPQALFVRLDVSDEANWLDVARIVDRKFGPTRVLVNNAGIVCAGEIIDLDFSAFERTQRINLGGTFLGIKTIAPGMIEAGGGSIINISSTEGLQGTNGLGAYSASKWAIRGLTKVAAMELSHRGVRVNSVHPGPINTAMGNPQKLSHLEMSTMHPDLPLGRAGHPDEVARVSLFLASEDASFMTGAELAVDGGMTIGSYLPFLPGTPRKTLEEGAQT